jgi:glycosyltransferase involved in cell wall biosynthesis
MNRNEQPFVSVIIPTYNRAAFLRSAIESLLAQTYSAGRTEIIVVDDGSTDNIREVVREYGQDIVYVGQENRGIAGARNSGIGRARGDLITFLDSDDMYSEGRIERVVEEFVKNPVVGMVYHAMELVDGDGRTIYKNFYKAFGYKEGIDGWVAKEVFSGAIFCGGSSFTFRKSLIDRAYPVPEDIRVGVDYYTTAIAACLAQAAYVPDILGKYRAHGDNATMLGGRDDIRRLATLNREFAHMRQEVTGKIAGLEGLNHKGVDIGIIKRIQAKEIIFCRVLEGDRIEAIRHMPALFEGRQSLRGLLRSILICTMTLIVPARLYPFLIRASERARRSKKGS